MKKYLSLFFLIAIVVLSCAGSTLKNETEKKHSIKVEFEEQIKNDLEEIDSAAMPISKLEISDKIEGLSEIFEEEIKLKETSEELGSDGINNAIEEETIADLNTLFQELNGLLSKYVAATGKVDYKGLVTEKTKLNSYITQASIVKINGDFSKDEQLAFWINLYNACTIKLICDHYPVKSIKEINSGKPWDLEIVEVDGIGYSLNEIENDIIRPKFNEPRIHFAVNCAAKSCPKLLNRAFFPNNLDADLTIATQEFLANKAQNQFEDDHAIVSKIFEWYNSDFGDLINFLNKYSPHIISKEGVVSYNEYDWSLNE